MAPADDRKIDKEKCLREILKLLKEEGIELSIKVIEVERITIWQRIKNFFKQ